MTALTLNERDDSVRPQDDLFRHINGVWLKEHQMPADRARDGVFRALFDRAEQQVKEIIQHAQSVPADDPDADAARKIATVYASFMDTERINALGPRGLQPDLVELEGLTNKADLARAMGRLQRRGVGSAIGVFINNDAGNPTQYRVYFTQSGIGLPDEAYYRDDTHAEVLQVYNEHVQRMLTLAGVATTEEAPALSGIAVGVEKALAAGHWDTVSARDAQKSYNPTTRDELFSLAPDFDWVAWAEALAPALGEDLLDLLIVRQPSYLQTFNDVFAKTSLEDLLVWQTWRVIQDRAPYLNEDIVEENFNFAGRTLTGTTQLRERWKRGVSFTESILGEDIGRLYVAQHFPPSHKEAMNGLVDDLIEAYRTSIATLEWMGEETRAKALEKLSKFTPKIGYPDRWRDYSDLQVGQDLLENVRAAAEFEADYELGKLGQPIDPTEWFMTPQTVNAYFNPVMNEIVFPAAILQPPFFDPEAPAAVNFGGIGAVIGHEIGHGFDDQGSRYDGDGRLHDWWSEQDRAEFTARTKSLIDQYDALSPAQLNGSHHVNGSFTIGENIGDLGGVGITIKAYRLARERGVDADLDERQALRLLFENYARIWRMKSRDEEAIRLLAIDPHSPAEFRCNQVVKNIDEFHDVFDTKPGDGLWLDPASRVRIWQ